MARSIDDLGFADGEPVPAAQITAAVTAGEFTYGDGSTQAFEPSGATTYVEDGRPTHGQWYVDDEGRFCSFWPPSYRASYDLRWVVENGRAVGLRFTETGRGSVFEGRYGVSGPTRACHARNVDT